MCWLLEFDWQPREWQWRWGGSFWTAWHSWRWSIALLFHSTFSLSHSVCTHTHTHRGFMCLQESLTAWLLSGCVHGGGEAAAAATGCGVCWSKHECAALPCVCMHVWERPSQYSLLRGLKRVSELLIAWQTSEQEDGGRGEGRKKNKKKRWTAR